MKLLKSNNKKIIQNKLNFIKKLKFQMIYKPKNKLNNLYDNYIYKKKKYNKRKRKINKGFYQNKKDNNN